MNEQILCSSPTGMRIRLSPFLVEGYTDEPARRHKRKRIQKKWLKRYGYKRKIDPNIYFTAEGEAIMHPDTFREFVKALGSMGKAITAVESFYISRREEP